MVLNKRSTEVKPLPSIVGMLVMLILIRFVRFNSFNFDQLKPKYEPKTLSISNPVTRYPCFEHKNDDGNSGVKNITVVYIQTVWYSLHAETFYSSIDQLCSCDPRKDSQWTLGSVPHFYVGPHELPSLKSVYAELNKASCGPIFFGTPSTPDLTVVTTMYQDSFNENYKKELRDPSKIFICHYDAPALEGDNVTNVYWLTPRHSRYVAPKFFPPTIVQHSKKLLDKNPNKSPVFLVMGSFTEGRKRNINSLKAAMKANARKNFTVRLLGGQSNHASKEGIHNFVNRSLADPNRSNPAILEVMPNLNDSAFMDAIGQVNVVLPLVDETNFYSTYQGGKKLTSAVSWGLGFGKKMVIYKPLAELFSLPHDKVTYWHYENSSTFPIAFEECLNSLGFGM